MANAANLINFGSGGGGALAVGDWTYSAYPLTAPAYLPLNDDTASYLTSSYPTLGATYAPTTVAYSTTTKNLPMYFADVDFTYNWNFLFGNKTFIAWTASGAIATSTDLTTWTTSGIPVVPAYAVPSGSAWIQYPWPKYAWSAMTYGAGKIVAVRPNFNLGSVGNLNSSAMSQDGGKTWTFGSLPNFNPQFSTDVTFTCTSVLYNQGMFTAWGYGYDSVNASYHGVVTNSSDGVNWSQPSAGTSIFNSAGSRTTSFLAYGNGVTLAFIANSTNLHRSTNKNYSWSTTISPPGAMWNVSCAYGAGLFVSVGTNSTVTVASQATTVYRTSSDGLTWTARTMPASLSWKSIVYENGYFVATGYNPTGAATTAAVATSIDGLTWVLQTVPSSINRFSLAGGNGKFVYQNDVSAQTLTQINLSNSALTFTLPTINTPPFGTQAYIKAT